MATYLRDDVAVLADGYPLRPHITLRMAGAGDPFCSSCGAHAVFVLLEIDVASQPPHPGDLECRVCYDWQRILVGACASCLPNAIESLNRELGMP